MPCYLWKTIQITVFSFSVYVHHMMRIKMQNILDPHSRSSLNRAIAPGFLRTFRKPHCKNISRRKFNSNKLFETLIIRQLKHNNIHAKISMQVREVFQLYILCYLFYIILWCIFHLNSSEKCFLRLRAQHFAQQLFCWVKKKCANIWPSKKHCSANGYPKSS